MTKKAEHKAAEAPAKKPYKQAVLEMDALARKLTKGELLSLLTQYDQYLMKTLESNKKPMTIAQFISK